MGVGLGVFRNQDALSLNFKSIADDGRMSWGWHRHHRQGRQRGCGLEVEVSLLR